MSNYPYLTTGSSPKLESLQNLSIRIHAKVVEDVMQHAGL
jgi:hypothetical protein